MNIITMKLKAERHTEKYPDLY